jgi:hypothetical protein
MARIDWSTVDPQIKQYLPQMTCVDFCEKYAPFTIPRTIGQRAKKLGIKPGKAVISEAQKAAISESVKSRTRWRVDWSQYDGLIKSKLPSMTIEDFCRTHCSEVSSKQIAKRARKLGITPAAPTADADKRNRIGEGVRQYRFTSKQDEYIKTHVDDMGQKEIAEVLGTSQMAIWRRMNELGLHRDSEVLGEVHKANGLQTGHMGGLATSHKIKNMPPDEYKAYCQRVSTTAQKAFEDGKIKPHHGIGQDMDTKKGGKFRTRSSYETRYAEILEDDSEVIRFKYEPFAIEYEFEGVKRFYTPDFLVTYDNRDELVEVKPERMVEYGRNPIKIETAKEYCNKHDLFFKVITEEDLNI